MDSIFQAVNLPPEACTPEAAKRHSPRADAPGDAKTAEMSVAPVRPHTASDPSRVKTSPTLNRFAHVNYWNRIILIGSSSLAVLAFDVESTGFLVLILILKARKKIHPSNQTATANHGH